MAGYELWSPGQITDRGFYNSNSDPQRFAVLKAPGTGEAPKADKVSFIFNFFEELRRKVPPGKN